MSSVRVRDRLMHIRDNVANIRALLEGRTLGDVEPDRFTRAALERFFEIISEPSRFIPAEMKQALGPDVPWQAVADLGNVLRHAYEKTDLATLWKIYTQDLDTLELAIQAMLADLDGAEA